MRIVIIGGTGHVGTYLVPRLVESGHSVISVSRQQRAPYQERAAWRSVTNVTIDRNAAEEEGTFGAQIRSLEPDLVIDMICFTLPSAKMLVEALKGEVQHFLLCGTIWVHGHSVSVPTTEDQLRNPFGEYGIQKAAIEEYLLREARQNGFPATVLHPGHIVGPGWAPLNPTGNFNMAVFDQLAKGEELVLPNLGMETVHHVHADDVAQAFMQAINYRNNAIGESFHVVSDKAMTLRGYAEAMAAWFGKEATLRFVPWPEWKELVTEGDAEATWDHIAHSPNCSIDKARAMLDFQPRYTSLQAVQEAIPWKPAKG